MYKYLCWFENQDAVGKIERFHDEEAPILVTIIS